MTLFFMQKHRDTMKIVVENDGASLIGVMLHESELMAAREVNLPAEDIVRRIYYSELCELMLAWCDDGMRPEATEKLVRNMLFLARTAKDRLRPLLN